jgi:hypothetical protein
MFSWTWKFFKNVDFHGSSGAFSVTIFSKNWRSGKADLGFHDPSADFDLNFR